MFRVGDVELGPRSVMSIKRTVELGPWSARSEGRIAPMELPPVVTTFGNQLKYTVKISFKCGVESVLKTSYFKPPCRGGGVPGNLLSLF